MAKKKIVIGVIGSDCHTVGNKIIHNKLEESGFDVVNIGALSPQIDFINAALETNSDAIIVSSIYGYGELDCQGIREKCNEYGLKDILLYVGGNIGSSNEDWEKTEKRFKEMGFDRIYKPGTPIEETIIDLIIKKGGKMSTHIYLSIDFGSTYTKLTAIDLDKKEIVATSRAMTTVKTDVLIGFNEAFEILKSELQNKLESYKIVKKVACSSAAGGLKIIAMKQVLSVFVNG